MSHLSQASHSISTGQRSAPGAYFYSMAVAEVGLLVLLAGLSAIAALSFKPSSRTPNPVEAMTSPLPTELQVAPAAAPVVEPCTAQESTTAAPVEIACWAE